VDIYVALTSIRRSLRGQGLTLTQAPDFAVCHGFRGLELSDRDLRLLDPHEAEPFRRRCDALGCGLVYDVNCDLTLADPPRWQAEVDYVKQMLPLARGLGARALRICLGGQLLSIQGLLRSSVRSTQGSGAERGANPDPKAFLKRLLLNRWTLQLARSARRHLPSLIADLSGKTNRAIAALRELMPTAARLRLPVVIENHWGIGTRPEPILQVIDALRSPWLGTCPDFGNFPSSIDRYQGLRLLAPKALHAQAKSWRFCRDGEERSIDYQRALGILREAGYSGPIAVEYEGAGDDLEGCLRTRALILRHWG
jgi:sugar phosphate isomerase/epimerase